MDLKQLTSWIVSVLVIVTPLSLAFPQHANTITDMPPIIVNQSDHYDNDTMSILCNATGEPAPRYKWFNNNIELESEAQMTLQLPQEKRGYYHCLAINDWGTAKSRYIPYKPPDFCYQSDPRVHRKISNVELSSGSDAILDCDHMTCSSPHAVEWLVKKNGRWIPVEANDPDMIKTSNGSLFLPNVQTNSMYQCKAHNFVEDYKSRGIQYKIILDDSLPQVKRCEEQPIEDISVTVVKGNDMSLDCLCAGSVTWTLPDGSTVSSHVIEIGDVIQQSRHSPRQVFTCKTADDLVRKKVHVIVEERPELLQPLEDRLKVPSNEGAEFRCSARGTHTAIQWYFNAEPLQGKMDGFEHHMKESSTVLSLDNFVRTPDGVFTSGVIQCNVSNSHGYIWQSARLTVIDGSTASVTPNVGEVNGGTTTLPPSSTTSPTPPTRANPAAGSTASSHSANTDTNELTHNAPHKTAPFNTRDSTTPSFPQSTPTESGFNLTIPQIIAIAVIPVFCLTCGICIAVCIMRVAWCGSARSKNKTIEMRYAPSNQSDAQSMARIEMHPLGPQALEEARILLERHKPPPSVAHSDSGLPDSEHESVKQQMMARYLLESQRYVERRKNSAVASVASSQGFAPSSSAGQLRHIPSVAKSCTPSMEQLPIYNRVQTTV